MPVRPVGTRWMRQGEPGWTGREGDGRAPGAGDALRAERGGRGPGTGPDGSVLAGAGRPSPNPSSRARIAGRGTPQGRAAAHRAAAASVTPLRPVTGGGGARAGRAVAGFHRGPGQAAGPGWPPGAGGRGAPVPGPGRRPVRRRLRLRLGRLAAVVVAAYLLSGLVLQQWALWQARQELRALDRQVQVLQDRAAELEAARRRIQDPAYVDETARERLGLVQPGETVIQLVDEPAAAH
ncbi:septum formation initiator [Thermaerobacter subterraneus DSM 13965]|uniref:Septum formation initiator n=1 Tax=Thermaerobacter subterraneus DSM 13965 TaxID=867903 RepID=K6Q0R2_9FIRM|nr:septum formation initiator [Thermaerobacter subterraneus DSM 13965]